jgi:hypothetical protein
MRTWIRYNGYAHVAFDQAQRGQFKTAQATLATAARQGISSVLVAWVRSEFSLLQHHSL